MPRKKDPAIAILEFFQTAELATAQTMLAIVDSTVRRRRAELETTIGTRRESSRKRPRGNETALPLAHDGIDVPTRTS
jgi:hypothetical protein